MIKFKDGPASGITLTLARAPVYLRVVRTDDGKWDALDQILDTPAPNEKIYVYRLLHEPGTCHVDGRDPKTGKRFGRWFKTADYEFVLNPPPDATLRDREKWQDWVLAQPLPDFLRKDAP